MRFFFGSHSGVLWRVLGLLVLPALTLPALLPAVGCRAEAPPPVAVVPPPPDTVRAPATDGGAVAMPQARRRVLVREDSLWARALRIHYNAIVIDGHIDTPTLMQERGYRFGRRHRSAESDVDLPRMYEGGLDAAFFSIYLPPSAGENARTVGLAREMIDEVRRQVAALPDSAEMARTAADVLRITRAGRKAILLGIEGGHALGGRVETLREMRDLGVRYVTLTHIHPNAFADASQDGPRWNGLNDLGRRMVREMNRLGLVVDLSHVSDSTFYDALRVSRAPVILSHSSVRALTEGVRNVDDAMLRALARNGGVVMINFFEAMVNPGFDAAFAAEVHRRLPGPDLHALWDAVYDVKRARGLPNAGLDDVLDHIDHAVRVAGIDHVGLGSDFDGVFQLPDGLQDATRYPWITYGLLRRGYSEEDVYKILGGNTLRVLEAAERLADSPR